MRRCISLLADTSKWKVSALEMGQRIDTLLSSRLEDHPRSHIFRLLRKGSVRVNGKRVIPSYRLMENDLISLPFQARTACVDRSSESKMMSLTLRDMEWFKNTVLMKSSDWFAINKPLGIPCQSGTGHKFGIPEYYTVVMGQKVYPVHRLDRFTTGVLLLAQDRHSARKLSEALADKQTIKVYECVVQGSCPSDWINKTVTVGLAKEGERMIVVPHRGLEATTIVSTIISTPQCSLLEVRLLSGRTHQIRATLAHLGYPIIGDIVYGGKPLGTAWRYSYPFLHSACLRLQLGIGQMTIRAPYHDKQSQCLRMLGLERNDPLI